MAASASPSLALSALVQEVGFAHTPAVFAYSANQASTGLNLLRHKRCADSKWMTKRMIYRHVPARGSAISLTHCFVPC